MSKEGLLYLRDFRMASDGLGASGPVEVVGEQDDHRVVSLTVSAFGQTVALSPDHLAALEAPINGVMLSYETGYARTGGRKVYVMLLCGFSSGVREMQTVSVNEQGHVTVMPDPDGRWRIL